MLKTKYSKIILLSLSLFTFIGFSTLAKAETSKNEPDQYVQVEAFANQKNISGGETIRLGLKQTIHPKWHTYWINPGDSGLPFEVVWDLPEGYSVTPLEWAPPQKITFDELTNYGYEDEVILLQNLTVPDSVSSEPITIKGKANLLVCHDICIPETHEMQLTFNDGSKANHKAIEQAENKLPKDLGESVSFYEKDNNLVIDIHIEDTILASSNIELTPEEWGLVKNSSLAKIEAINSGLRITQERGERDLSEVQEFHFVISDKNRNQSYRLKAINNGLEKNKILSPTQQDGSDISFIKAIIFALFGGLILNLMPCVFPVLSMKSLSLVQLGDKNEEKARFYGLSYTAGILISFGVIAGILILLKSAGAQIGWGFQLQNPIVISLLAYLIFIIGLNLAGFFEFSNKLGNIGQKFASQSGNKGAFFTGVLATLVATPCTAPFMGAAMGYALTQGAVISLLVFLALGLGLALPYLALCFIPSLRTKLPKPGVWMKTFKEFLSFPMFLTAAFLIWVLSQQAGSMSVLVILVAMVAITFTIWLWQALPQKGFSRLIALLLLALSALFATYVPFSLKTNGNLPSTQEEKAYSAEYLSALLEGDDPIFTNMTAAWCITCKVNERVALKTKKVQSLFIENNIQYLKGDWTNRNAEISKYLNYFGRQGVPLYVYYAPRDKETGSRPAPVLLPQILTPDTVKQAIQQP